MTIMVRPYQSGDIDRIDVQPGQRGEMHLFHRGMTECGPAFSIERDGALLMCAGLAEILPWYANAWAIFAPGLRGDYAAIVRAIARVLDASSYRRVDTLVRNDWPRAHALVRMLKFECEGVTRSLGRDGEDFATYARIREKGNEAWG